MHARPSTSNLASESRGDTACIVIIEASKTTAKTTAGAEALSHRWTLSSGLNEAVETVGLAERRGLVVVVQAETRETDTSRRVAT